VEGFWDEMNKKSLQQIVDDTGIDKDAIAVMFLTFRIPTHIPDIVPKVIASLTAPIRSKTRK
jgi:hypothetical protein